MSNWHVKTTSKDGRRASVVFHIPVPVGSNDASPAKSWRDAIAEQIKPQNTDGSFGTWFSQLQGIDAGELGQIQAGELFEKVDNVAFQANDSDLEKRDKIDTKFTELSTEIINEKKAELKFWGFARDLP